MSAVIYRKSDLVCVGTLCSNMTIEQEIELNVIPNFGGNKEDYDSIEVNKINFYLSKDKNGNVIALDNLILPSIAEPIDKEKVAMAEAIIDLEARLSALENK